MTVKKFIALASAAIAAAACTATAQVDVTVASDYIFRGATVVDDIVVQPGFGTTAFGDTIDVGTWANFNTDTSEFDEIDYYFSYSIPMEGEVSIDVGYTEYTYPTAGIDADREPFVSLGFAPAETVETSLMLAYGIDGGIEDSLYAELGLGLALMEVENVGVGASAALGYVDPDEGESGFSHLTLGVGVDLGIPETDRSVSVGVNYVVETDEDVLVVEEDFFFTVGATL